MTYERKESSVSTSDQPAGLAAELGADIIKVLYPGNSETLSDRCDELVAPMVILGDSALGTVEELYEMVQVTARAVVRGIVIGHRVWRRRLAAAVEVPQCRLVNVNPDHAPTLA